MVGVCSVQLPSEHGHGYCSRPNEVFRPVEPAIVQGDDPLPIWILLPLLSWPEVGGRLQLHVRRVGNFHGSVRVPKSLPVAGRVIVACCVSVGCRVSAATAKSTQPSDDEHRRRCCKSSTSGQTHPGLLLPARQVLRPISRPLRARPIRQGGFGSLVLKAAGPVRFGGELDLLAWGCAVTLKTGRNCNSKGEQNRRVH